VALRALRFTGIENNNKAGGVFGGLIDKKCKLVFGW